MDDLTWFIVNSDAVGHDVERVARLGHLHATTRWSTETRRE